MLDINRQQSINLVLFVVFSVDTSCDSQDSGVQGLGKKCKSRAIKRLRSDDVCQMIRKYEKNIVAVSTREEKRLVVAEGRNLEVPPLFRFVLCVHN